MTYDDAVLAQLVQEARSANDVVGLLLSGSRAAGTPDAGSDYDVHWVVTDAAFEARRAAGGREQVRRELHGAVVDLVYAAPRTLRRVADEPGWYTAGYAHSRVLLDKTGEIERLLGEIRTLSSERAREQAAEWYDAYLNSFYRSLKAWRRGNELAGRIEAAESVMHLARTLFALERRWAPYPKDLAGLLDSLADPQGWAPRYLELMLMGILKTGDPALQQELEAKVERLLDERGFRDVCDAWEGEIDRVKAFRFG